MKKLSIALVLASLAVAGCSDSVVNATDGAAKSDQAGKKAATHSLVDAAIAYNSQLGVFDLLIHALTRPEQSGVLEVLGSKGQYTVFAPVDDAFLAFLSAVAGSPVTTEADAKTIIDGLDPNTLSRVLTYHAATGRRYSPQVVESEQIRMLSGEFASIEVMSDPLTVKVDGEALVLELVDIDTYMDSENNEQTISNGVIHVVSGVLNPLN